MLKKTIAFALALMLAFTLAACGGNSIPTGTPAASSGGDPSTPAASAPSGAPALAAFTNLTLPEDYESVDLGVNEILVGFYGALTGDAANVGGDLSNGFNIVFDQVNALGGVFGVPIRVVELDDKGEPEMAVRCATNLIEEHQVDVIIGSHLSVDILASADVVGASGIPEVGLGNSPSWLQLGYDNIFRATAVNSLSNVVVVQAALDMGFARMSSIYQDTETAKTQYEDMSAQLRDAGVEVAQGVSFLANTSDFTGQIAQLLSSDPEAILMAMNGEYYGPFLRQLRQAGFDGFVFGTDGLSGTDVLAVAGDATNKAVFGSACYVPEYDSFNPDEIENLIYRDFLIRYTEAYKQMPKHECTVRAYDAAWIIVQGILNARSVEKDALTAGIEAIQSLQGAEGVYSFTGNGGEGLDTTNLYVYWDGRIVQVNDSVFDDMMAAR